MNPGSVSLTAGGSEKLVQSTLPLPLFAPMKKKKALRLVFICMLFNIINSVTLHTTSNNDKYCNGNVKNNIIHVFHVFEKNSHILK